MLFDVEADPHLTKDVSGDNVDTVMKCLGLLERWNAEMMATASDDVDPMWTVIREGGPFHTRGWLAKYCDRLRATGRAGCAEELAARHPYEP